MSESINSITENECHIFVIDDSKFHNIILKKMLTAKGYAVKTFTNGFHLLEQLQQTEMKPHLIISDIEMPEIDGFTLFEEIKNHSGIQNIPFMYISSLSPTEVNSRVEATGAEGFIQKPISKSTFWDTINQIIFS